MPLVVLTRAHPRSSSSILVLVAVLVLAFLVTRAAGLLLVLPHLDLGQVALLLLAIAETWKLTRYRGVQMREEGKNTGRT